MAVLASWGSPTSSTEPGNDVARVREQIIWDESEGGDGVRDSDDRPRRAGRDAAPGASMSSAEIGDVLGGRYRLTRPIARGGMAEVWEAVDATLDREVAVKVLHSHLADDPGFVSRFNREARAVARLSHPNVVAVFDTGIDAIAQGRPGAGLPRAFLVMELLRGHSVRMLSQQGVPLTRAVWIVAEAAKGLGYAHRQGLVHRDVKPANILVTDTGIVKVVDFGIAKLTEGTDRAGEDLTQAGAILGTAKYLSPEQVEGGEIDARADVYSLGVVLYELVCGRPPFVGKNDMGTALQHVKDAPPPPRSIRAGIPRSLEALILQALAKNPQERPPDANAFSQALSALDLTADDASPSVRRGPDDHTPPAGVGRRPRVGRSSDDTRFDAGTRVRPPPSLGVQSTTPTVSGGGGRRLAVRVLLALIAIAAGIGGGIGFAEQTKSTPGSPFVITSIRSFDPLGNNEENDDILRLAIDGQVDTAWESRGYGTRTFDGIDGVGVIVDLGADRTVRSLGVSSYDEGWSGEVYVSNRPAPSLAGWGSSAGEIRNATRGEFTVKLTPTNGRYLLVWITDLGPKRGSLYKAALSELRVFG